jgi:hypothetical protein
MTPRRREQLEAKLAETESRLRSLLLPALERAAESGEALFFNSAFLPAGYRLSLLPPESEASLELACEAVALREQLAESVVGTVGQLYLSACQEAANTANEQRRGPRRLASWLLAELQSRHGT